MSTRNVKMNSVTFGNSKIKYKVKKSSRRNTSQITVNRLGVQVISPSNKNHKQIETLVKKHVKWIYKKQLLVKEEKFSQLTFEHGSKLPFLGKNYLLDVRETKKTIGGEHMRKCYRMKFEEIDFKDLKKGDVFRLKDPNNEYETGRELYYALEDYGKNTIGDGPMINSESMTLVRSLAPNRFSWMEDTPKESK